MPKLPLKKGERDAFNTTSAFVNDHWTPIFVVPPAGDFDHDVGRITTPAEHVRLFGKRLFESRRNRPNFIDALYLDDERHRVAFNVHPLTALLERARLAHAQAWPLTSYGRSDAYQEAVAKAHLAHQCPVGIQISLAELGMANLSTRVTSLCNQVSCDPLDAVLVVDAGPLFLRDEADKEEFANTLIAVLNELPRLYEWRQVSFVATSLTDPPKIKVGEQKSIRRSEWHVYRRLLERRAELYRLPIFGDYGVEYKKKLAPIKVMPSAKMTYTTDDSHFCVKGQNVEYGGYEAIYPVADAIVCSPHFKGSEFSRGDAHLLLLSQRRATTGTAATWRWIAVDHHLAMLGKQLPQAIGMLAVIETGLQHVEQGSLLSLIPAK